MHTATEQAKRSRDLKHCVEASVSVEGHAEVPNRILVLLRERESEEELAAQTDFRRRQVLSRLQQLRTLQSFPCP